MQIEPNTIYSFKTIRSESLKHIGADFEKCVVNAALAKELPTIVIGDIRLVLGADFLTWFSTTAKGA